MKTCTLCRQTKEFSDFHRHKDAKDGLQSRCKTCNSKETLRYYHSDTKGIKSKIKETTRKRVLKLRLEIADYKKAKGCFFCGENEPVCLDFHHIDPSNKKGPIAFMKGRYSEATLWKEVAKCQVICSNCHRKLHTGILSLPSTI